MDQEKNNSECKNIQRIDARYIFDEAQKLFLLEKGFLFTVKELFMHPGRSIRQFLLEDRTKLVKPIVFLFFASLMFTLITRYFIIPFNYFRIDTIPFFHGVIEAKILSDWTNSNLGYTNIFISFFIALWVRILFKKHHYTYFEIVVLLFYILGEAIFLLAIFTFFIALAKNQPTIILILAIFVGLLYQGYPIWAIGNFFTGNKCARYTKALLSYFLGVISYLFFLSLIAYILSR